MSGVTFLTVQNNIANYLNRSDLTTEIQLAINRAISIASKNRFWFDEATGVFNTVPSQQSYGVADGIPSNIRNITFLRLTVSAVYYQLCQRDINYIIAANVNNNTSQPTDWAWFEQKIYFYPTPSSSTTYPVTVYYHKTYDDLVFPSDTNDFLTNPEALEMIENYALYWLYGKVILDDGQAAKYYKMFEEALVATQAIENNLLGIDGGINPMDW